MIEYYTLRPRMKLEVLMSSGDWLPGIVEYWFGEGDVVVQVALPDGQPPLKLSKHCDELRVPEED